jgi:hypothetical protein
MYPPQLRYLLEKGTAWFDPCNGLTGFWSEYRNLKNKLGKPHKYVWNHRELKRAKEIYATSIVAMAMSKSDNKRWWILKPEFDPPDGVIGTKVEINGIEEMHVREVEVVEHLNGEIVDTIRKKLSDKRYEPNTALVCYVSQSGTFNAEEISKTLINEETSLNHIFLVFVGIKLSEISLDLQGNDFLRSIYKTSSVQLKPVYSYINVDPINDCKQWMAGKTGNYFIFDGRGRGGSRAISLENPPKLF